MSTLYILYGSVTGNAEHIAQDLAASKLPPEFTSVICEPMEEFKKYSNAWLEAPKAPKKKHGLILISSTTGNGDAPENASRFVRYVKRKTTVDAQPFKNVAFAVLGLGDTNYDQFCNTGKILDKKMVELGGTRVKPLACADEATGLEDTVEPWVDCILKEMVQACFESGNTKSEGNGGAEKEKQETDIDNQANNNDNVNETTSPPALVAEDNGSSASENKSSSPPPPAAAAAAAVVVESSPADLPTKSDSPLFIMYGSATGNAEQIANDLAASYEAMLQNPDAYTYFPSVICCDLDHYKKKASKILETQPSIPGTKHGVLLVASTTGNGEAPENCNRFVRFIKRNTTVEQQPFKHTAFAVLGLGDTNYDIFCNTGKTIDRKMGELGGVRAKPLACADEAVGLEEVVDPWTNSILLDITNACRGGAGAVSKTAAATTTKELNVQEEEEEEKKMETMDGLSNNDSYPPSIGVQMVRKILSLTDSQPIGTVNPSMLPSVGVSATKFKLVSANDPKNNVVSSSTTHAVTDSDDNISVSSDTEKPFYTLKNPYSSTIIGARYLTNTSTDAASQVCQTLKDKNAGDDGANENASLQTDSGVATAMKIFDEHFSLPLPNSGRKSSDLDLNAKRVIEATFKLPGSDSDDDDNANTLSYEPGDSIGLIVRNHPDAVSFILAMLQQHYNIIPTQLISINNNDAIVTVQYAVQWKYDITSPVKSKRFIRFMSQYAKNPQESLALQMISSKTPQGETLFQKYIVNQCKSVVGLLQDFPSCQGGIPWEQLFGLLPSITPRYYSVSSSPLNPKHGNRCLTVAFSVVDYLTESFQVQGQEYGLKRVRGLATRYLESICAPYLAASSLSTDSTTALTLPTLSIYPKPSPEFRLPKSLSTPIVLIGPGTGIAPFMGFLSHRQEQIVKASAASSNDSNNDNSDDNAISTCQVYFGCRHANHDWLYKDEMLDLWRNTKAITNLYTAFSRDHDYDDNDAKVINDNKRTYVQDLMKQSDCAQELSNIIIKEKGIIYICGDGSQMAKDVQQTIVDLLNDKLNGVGKQYLQKMKSDGRLLLDIWAS